MLVLMYYLAQNPSFTESVKPLMGQLKNSEQMLSFLNDLSNFTNTFSTFRSSPKPQEESSVGDEKDVKTDSAQKPNAESAQDNKTPQSPTSGIADAFIEQILESYLKKH